MSRAILDDGIVKHCRLQCRSIATAPPCSALLNFSTPGHMNDLLPPDSQLTCWFPYSTPDDAEDYRVNFQGAGMRFAAPFFAFAFDRAHDAAPLPGADAILHPLHCHRANAIQEEIAQMRVSRYASVGSSWKSCALIAAHRPSASHTPWE